MSHQVCFGFLYIVHCCTLLAYSLLLQIVREYTFLDYIMGGCQINFTVSVEIFLLLK